jgi:hypothetical protein
MSFYHKQIKNKHKNGEFSNATTYKKNRKNLNPNEGNLFEKFWEVLKKEKTFNKIQEEILQAVLFDAMKYVFVRCGRKGSKTTSNIFAAWGYCLLEPKRSCYITLPTKDLGEEIYWDERRLQDCDFKGSELNDLFVKNENDPKKTLTFINGSFIKIRGTWREAGATGTQPNLLIIDEIKDCSPDYLENMDPNLAAKDDAICIMTGTPPKKKNFYHQWEDRIRGHSRGLHLHYSSYVNTALPHLKPWLDSKKEELIKAGKEDVWLREYMAEDCFSSAERVLPNISLKETNETYIKLRAYDSENFTPIVALTIMNHKICIVYALSLYIKEIGAQFWILKTETKTKIWDKSYNDIYNDIEKQFKSFPLMLSKDWRLVVYDQTKSFSDVITNVAECRTDLKWTDRGVPLLKELILNNNITFTVESEQFGVESQSVLKEDDIREFPTVCTLAMLANEYYQSPSLSNNEQEVWDQFAPLREAGIICTPPKRKGRGLISYNWN